jgi:glycosyltransferase involved in cell wall biosynthesis
MKTLPSQDNSDSSTKIVVVMPAYNAERTLKSTLDDLPRDSTSEIILVDDGSRDDTVALAKSLGLKVFSHIANFGYGANQKTCYTEALKTDGSIVVMIHPDYQYDPSLLPEIVRPIQSGNADVVFGSRMMGTSALSQGMPWWKYYSNKFLTWLENKAFHLNLSEFHTGYRAYSRSILEQVNFRANDDGFIFDQEIVAQFVEAEARIAEVPVPVRYFPEASSAGFLASVRYGLGIVWLLFRFILHRLGIWRSMQFVSHGTRYRSV